MIRVLRMDMTNEMKTEPAKLTERYNYHWLTRRVYGGRWTVRTDKGVRLGSFDSRVEAMIAIDRAGVR